MRATVIGGAGYIGGELVRLVLGHPDLELAQVTSTSKAGRPLRSVHPNLRGQTDLAFVTDDEVVECDVLFLAVPHGASAGQVERWSALAPLVVDLSADFRITDPERRQRYYPGPAPDPLWQKRFEAGIPELNRDGLRGATHIAVAGCMANASILALQPLAKAGLVSGAAVLDARSGSSGAGRTPDEGSHHPERSGALRMAKPFGHRHTAEIEAATGLDVHMSVTAVEAVRGVQVACHLTPWVGVTEQDVAAAYRAAYRSEPFVRVIRERSALHRMPDPKILSGTNFCDIGFALDTDRAHLVVVSALDNLMKGGAGNAVQCFNIATGRDETAGLGFVGLHPV